MNWSNVSWTNWFGASIGAIIAAAGVVVLVRQRRVGRPAHYGLAAFFLLWGASVLLSNTNEIVGDGLLGKARGFYRATYIVTILLALSASLALLWTTFWWPTTPPGRHVLPWSFAAGALAFVVVLALNPATLVQGAFVKPTALLPDLGEWGKPVIAGSSLYAFIAAAFILTGKL
ncbi:MAG: hypothetical protein ABR586_05595, partial [Thermoplasmatota archaeon]